MSRVPRGLLESQSPPRDDDDDDEEQLWSLNTRNNKYMSPVPRPDGASGAPKRPRHDPGLQVVPETAPEVDPDVKEGGHERTPQLSKPRPDPNSKFNWDAGGPDARLRRELKLAYAVQEALAYDCPAGTLEKRWRKVLDAVKGEFGTSELFTDLKPNVPTSTSHRTLHRHFTLVFDAWQRGERAEAATSGAAGTFNELDTIYTTIQKDKASGLGRVTKPPKNSYQKTSLDALNRALETSIGGAARRFTEKVRDEIEACGSDDDEKDTITPKRQPPPEHAEDKKGRGPGKASRISAASSELHVLGMQRMENDEKERERQYELEKRRLELEEKREEREEKREEREERRAERDARQQELFMKMMEKLAER